MKKMDKYVVGVSLTTLDVLNFSIYFLYASLCEEVEE
jgi:hypothetical protein